MITTGLIKEFLNYGSCLNRFSYKNIPITLFYDAMKGSGFEHWMQYTLMSFLQGVYRNSIISTEYPISGKQVDIAKEDKVQNPFGGIDSYVSLLELKCANAQHTVRGVDAFVKSIYQDVAKLDELCAPGTTGSVRINSAESLGIIVHEQFPIPASNVQQSVNGNPVFYDTAHFDFGGHYLHFEIIVIPNVKTILPPSPLVEFKCM